MVFAGLPLITGCNPDRRIVVWHSHNGGVVAVLDDEDRRDTVTLELLAADEFRTLLQVAERSGCAARNYDQQSFVRLLRVELAGCLEDPTVIGSLRQLDWEKAEKGHATSQHGKESLGKSIQAKVAFSAWGNRLTKRRRAGDMREHRTVVLPDFQGLGIGNRLSEFCTSIWRGVGGRAFSTTSHPAMIRCRSASPRWKRQRLGMVNKTGTSGIYAQSLRRANKIQKLHSLTACERMTAGFEYVGEPMPRVEVERFGKARPIPFSPSGRVVSVEAVVARYPGATTRFVARVTGLSPSAARAALEELVERGEVVPVEGGRRQYAFYPMCADR